MTSRQVQRRTAPVLLAVLIAALAVPAAGASAGSDDGPTAARGPLTIVGAPAMLPDPVPPVPLDHTDRLVVLAPSGPDASRAGSLVAELTARTGGQVVAEANGRIVLELAAPVPLDVARATARDLVSAGLVSFAEPDPLISLLRVPNDPLWPQQWGPRGLRMPDVWALSTGSRTRPVVAVLDTGVEEVPELRGRVRPGLNAVERSTDVRDANGHGTLTAGVIAGRGDDGTGFAGQCWACEILPVKIMSDEGIGSMSHLADGIRWAVDNGADLINISAGGPSGSSTVANALTYAEQRGVPVIASAGNDGVTTPFYPAAYPTVLSVAASSPTGDLETWSNHGSSVDVAAPGCNVAQRPDHSFGWHCGTSSAAPFTTGLLALARDTEPSTPPSTLRERARSTAQPLSGIAGGLLVPTSIVPQPTSAPAPSPAPSPEPAADADPVLSPPAVTTAVAGNRSVAVTWTAPSDTEQVDYRVHRTTSSTCPSTAPVVWEGTTGSTVVNGLTNGTTYRFCVSAVPTNGETTDTGTSRTATPSAGSQTCSPLTGDWDVAGRDGIGWWCDGRVRLRTASGEVIAFNYGRRGDVPVVADWNGDGRDTVSIIRDGAWHLNDNLGGGDASRTFTYGRVSRGDLPIAGRWDGGARSLPAIVRDGTWHLRLAQASGPSDLSFVYGRLTQGDLALWGDWNGDGRDTAGIVRVGTWHLRNVHRGGTADLSYVYGRVTSGDRPVVGDWNGDGRDTPGIVRGDQWMLKHRHGGGSADVTLTLTRP